MLVRKLKKCGREKWYLLGLCVKDLKADCNKLLSFSLENYDNTVLLSLIFLQNFSN